MSFRISLVRHGRSSYVQKPGWFSYDDMLGWREGYDASGILATERPTDALVSLTERCEIVVASDLPRAIETAEHLTLVRPVTTSPLLREAHPPLPRWKSVRLPRRAWEYAMLVRWLVQVRRGTDISADEQRRGVAAVDWLEALLATHAHVVVVTHGMFRRVLARELERRAWTNVDTKRDYKNWGVWSYETNALRPR